MTEIELRIAKTNAADRLAVEQTSGICPTCGFDHDAPYTNLD